MNEIIEWLMEPQSAAETLVLWVLVAVMVGCVAALVRMAVRSHRGDQVSAKRGSKLVAAVPFAGGKSKGQPAEVKAGELAQVLPLLPRAEREALRAGGWS